MNKIYTGIGSRETPEAVLKLMGIIGYKLAELGWTLRSGHAPGADQAFENGANLNGISLAKMEIYLPWPGFMNAPKRDPRYISPINECQDTWRAAYNTAMNFHPNWLACNDSARRLHTRNVYQVVGKDLNTPSNLVICWTKDGKRGGGTGQALRIAEYLKIPIFDLAVCTKEDIEEFILKAEK